MKVKELIEKLNKIQEERGNLEIKITSTNDLNFVENLEGTYIIEKEEIDDGKEPFVYLANGREALQKEELITEEDYVFTNIAENGHYVIKLKDGNSYYVYKDGNRDYIMKDDKAVYLSKKVRRWVLESIAQYEREGI